MSVGMSITINGGGITFDANGNTTRFFTVQTGSTLTINNVVFQNGDPLANGGAILNGGNLFVNDSVFRLNKGNNGGAISNAGNGVLTITNSIFSENEGVTNGGAIHNDGLMTATNSKLTGNQAIFGDGIFVTNTANAASSFKDGCIVGNGDGLHLNENLDVDNNWWGNSAGPTIISTGTYGGDAIIEAIPGQAINATNSIPYPLIQSTTGYDCPAIINDIYSMQPLQTLTVDASQGLVANDIGVNTNSVDQVGILPTIGPSFGNLIALGTDGSFMYQSTSAPPNGVDGFKYRVDDLEGESAIGLACITVSQLEVEVPPPQTASVGVPLNIPDVQVTVSGNANVPNLVRVDLSVSQGILTVTGGMSGTPTLGTPGTGVRKSTVESGDH